MAYALKKYFARAPRYLFEKKDNSSIRFARPNKDGNKKSYSTTLVDVSQSGASFLVHKDLDPKLNETLMVEFTVPGSEQMACYAKVVRLDHQVHNSNEVAIAVSFHELMSSHKNNLAKGLQKKFRHLKTKKQLDLMVKKFHYRPEDYKTSFFWLFSGIATVVIFYLILSQP